MSCTLYFWNGTWHVATKNTPDGSEEIVSVVGADNKYYYKSKKLMYNAWYVASNEQHFFFLLWL